MLLQSLWDYILGHSALLSSPFFPVLFTPCVYISFSLPFILLDLLSPHLAWVRSYKIQGESQISWTTMGQCLGLFFYNYLVYLFPIILVHWYLRPISLPTQAPQSLRLVWDVLACLLLFDFQYFFWHLLHHRVPWLYRTFHKVHHTHTSTSVLTTQYSGVWETLSLGFFASINPYLLGCHPLTEMLFYVLNIWLSVEDHCGYDLPWATHRLVPFGFYGGAPHHDLHHLKFRSNFAPYFTHWDRLFGTLHEH
ncbi:cholesterol 25-hydroxylase-like protein [Osmerus mordax]|uniref:cholesterol 25-hydroxylase-like protein n=1 Tax=Osmerus mordax TaxID=8014 RepID=UPI00350EA053